LVVDGPDIKGYVAIVSNGQRPRKVQNGYLGKKNR
jgi:hypothetical protein